MGEPIATVVARIEERLVALDEKLDDWKAEMDAQGRDILSLNLSRSNMKGGAWVLSGLATVTAIVVGFWKS